LQWEEAHVSTFTILWRADSYPVWRLVLEEVEEPFGALFLRNCRSRAGTQAGALDGNPYGHLCPPLSSRPWRSVSFCKKSKGQFMWRNRLRKYIWSHEFWLCCFSFLFVWWSPLCSAAQPLRLPFFSQICQTSFMWVHHHVVLLSQCSIYLFVCNSTLLNREQLHSSLSHKYSAVGT